MRVAFAVFAALAVVAAAGCGGDSSVTRGEYVQQGNDICRDTRKQVDSVPKATPPTLEDLRQKTPAAREHVRKWAAYSRKLDEIGKKAQDRLMDLETPDELRDRRDALQEDFDALDRAGKAANNAGQRLLRAARSGTSAEVRTATAASRKAAQRQADIADRIRSRLNSIGWTACAQAR